MTDITLDLTDAEARDLRYVLAAACPRTTAASAFVVDRSAVRALLDKVEDALEEADHVTRVYVRLGEVARARGRQRPTRRTRR